MSRRGTENKNIRNDERSVARYPLQILKADSKRNDDSKYRRDGIRKKKVPVPESFG